MREFAYTMVLLGVAFCFAGLMVVKYPFLFIVGIEAVLIGGFYIALGFKADVDADKHDRFMRQMDIDIANSRRIFEEAMNRIDPNWRTRFES